MYSKSHGRMCYMPKLGLAECSVVTGICSLAKSVMTRLDGEVPRQAKPAPVLTPSWCSAVMTAIVSANLGYLSQWDWIFNISGALAKFHSRCFSAKTIVNNPKPLKPFYWLYDHVAVWISSETILPEWSICKRRQQSALYLAWCFGARFACRICWRCCMS